VSDLNINDDSRDRGLEILLYKKEKNSHSPQKDFKKFKLNFVIPFPFGREFNFHFEAFIIKKHKPSGK
jgi:hypothetical protein